MNALFDRIRTLLRAHSHSLYFLTICAKEAVFEEHIPRHGWPLSGYRDTVVVCILIFFKQLSWDFSGGCDVYKHQLKYMA